MDAPIPAMTGSRLRSLAQRSAREREDALERCELCSAPIAPEHRHLLDLRNREVMCACRACSTLFDSTAAGGGHYRLIADRRLMLADFDMSDVAWEELRLPVDIAYFFHHTDAERVAAYYPSPMGATESLLTFEAWHALESANPVLAKMTPDVEALLVNRSLGARRQWIVPIDDCYALVGLIRTSWRGFTGGKEVWEQIGRFFDELDRRSKPARRDGTRLTSAAPAGAAERS
jgi:hypothetical protein